MKQINTKTKIFSLIILVIIIAGIIVIAIKGFNVEKTYRSNDIATIYVGKEIDMQKAKEISSEIFGEKLSAVHYVENYKDIIQIVAQDITDEQKQNIADKINQIYAEDASQEETANGEEQENNTETSETTDANTESQEATDNTENQEATNNNAEEQEGTDENAQSEDSIVDVDDIEIIKESNIRVRDLLTPYITSLIIITVTLLIYVGIRFHKIGIIKSVLKTGATIAITQIVIVSLMAVTRFPIGRFTPSVVLLAYILSVFFVIKKLEKSIK